MRSLQFKFKGVAMRSFCSFLLVLASSLLLIPAAQAQSGKGAIAGHVTDSSGGALIGAQVSVQPTDATAVSDAVGQFFINDLGPGSYTVTVSYVGFRTFTQTMNVTAGQTAGVDAKLEVGSQNLEVLVTAERASGEAEEINREIAADNVVQVLTSDVIRSLPNANMADALGRLPSVTLERDEGEGKYVQVRGTEPRLTNVTIDGINVPSPENNVRQIKLDAIPADIVESVEINKTLQANMDADGIGGSVNLVTKTAAERPTVNLSGMGGYTPIVGGRGLVETTGTVGKRFGSSKRWGALIGGSYDWNGRGIDDTEPVSDIATPASGSPFRFIDAADIREYRYYRSRWGLAGSADYKLKEGSSIYFRAFYSDFKNYGDRWVYSLTDNTPLVNNQVTPPQNPNGISILNSNGCSFDSTTNLETCGGGTPTFNASIRRPDYAIANFVAGGKHVLTSTWFAWDVSAARARQLERGDPQANFGVSNTFNTNFPNGSTCQYDPAATKDLLKPQWSQSCFTEAYNPANLSLSDLDLFGHGLSAQLNLQVTGAGAKRYRLGSRLATIEIGGRFRNAHKFDDSFRTNYAFSGPAAQDPALTMFLNNFKNGNYYGGSYPLGPAADYFKVLAFYNANPSMFTLNKGQAGPGYNATNYDLVERVSAGYLMNTLDLTNRIRLVAGIRFENTNLDTTVPTFDSTGAFTFLTNTSGSYLRTLPSASLRFDLGHDTNLRVAYGRGLGRPNPTDIAQAVQVTFVAHNDPRNAVSLGNPNLKAETADNIDILVEHSLKPFGLITAGYFYKNLTDPIVSTSFLETFTPPTTTTPDTYTVSQTINAGSAWVQGLEAAYLQHLTFLPGPLSGFGISANIGYTASRASGLPGRSDHPRLVRSAPTTWNISPTYDRGRLSVRAGFSYNQANIFSYQFHDGTGGSTPTPGGLSGPNSDTYLYTHLEIDIQGSLRLAHGLSFVMYGLNLNNEVFGFYNGSTPFLIQREFYRPTVAAGMRWSPTHEK
jgi:TonB-dependent receptor